MPSAAVFALDDADVGGRCGVVSGLKVARQRAWSESLADRLEPDDIRAAIGELLDCARSATSISREAASPRMLPKMPIPLQTLVLNVTSKCNLACGYCYEYGEDKIVDTATAGRGS